MELILVIHFLSFVFLFFRTFLQYRIGIGAYGHEEILNIFTRQLVPRLSYNLETDLFIFHTYEHPVSPSYSPFFAEAIHLSCNATNNECNSFVSDKDGFRFKGRNTMPF